MNSPYTNILTEVPDGAYDEAYSKEGEIKTGLKPYVYYSCRYAYGVSDFSITYTLDNYITIQGIIKGSYVYDYGYLYNIANTKNAPRYLL